MKCEIRKIIIRKIHLKKKPKNIVKENPLDNRYVRDSLKFAEDMLFSNKVRLHDIPYSLRTLKPSVYVIALRISRAFTKERYLEDLRTLRNDTQYVDPLMRYQLERQYESLFTIYKSNVELRGTICPTSSKSMID